MSEIASINLAEKVSPLLAEASLQFGELPHKQRVQLVWEICWPCAAVATIVLLAQRLLGLKDGNLGIIAINFLIFFAFSPWVIP